VSRGQRAGAVAAAIGIGAASLLDRRAALATATVAVVVTVARTLRHRPVAGSAWRRGWNVVTIALLPAAGALAVNDLAGGVGAILLLLAAGLVFVGITGSLPDREPARTRELVLEAALGGGLCTYLVGAVLVDVSMVQLVAVAVGTSTWWLLVLLLVREGEQVTGAVRWLTWAFSAVLALHLVALVVAGHRAGELAVRSAAGVVVVAWAMAGGRPELRERVPTALAPVELLYRGHVRLLLAGVLAGPVAVTANWALDGASRVLPLAAGGGILALVSVLHLLQLVRDHGRRAFQARHDALTGLPSEPLFEDRMERAMARGRRAGSGFTVAFLDLDGFKRVNDRDGHEAGDRVLHTVGMRLRSAVRDEDTVARRSGDEFLLLFEGLDDPAAAERVATKLLAVLREPIPVEGRHHRLGASIGLARWPRDGVTAEELMRHADAAMYEAKERGSGAVRWYSTAATTRSRLRLTLAQQLEAAVDTADQLELAFHPRVDLRDGRVVELVALVRWRHPQLGLLLPASFLPLAAETGLTRSVDVAILELACTTMRRWQEDGLIGVPVLVHVADASIGHPDLEEDVVGVLRRTGLQPPQLGLAVAEAGLGRTPSRAARTIEDLAEIGVRTTVTRFGTGNAGVGALASIPLAALELAAPLVARLDSGPPPAVIGAALALADRLALTPTAGGVTSAEQAERLRAAGCGSARGPYLAAPALAHALERRLQQVAVRGGPRHPLLAGDLAGEGLPGGEQPDVAAVLAATATADEEVDEGVLAELLARLQDATPT
jgi:diguanylate cyclase (GGDEF)-like protein